MHFRQNSQNKIRHHWPYWRTKNQNITQQKCNNNGSRMNQPRWKLHKERTSSWEHNSYANIVNAYTSSFFIHLFCWYTSLLSSELIDFWLCIFRLYLIRFCDSLTLYIISLYIMSWLRYFYVWDEFHWPCSKNNCLNATFHGLWKTVIILFKQKNSIDISDQIKVGRF